MKTFHHGGRFGDCVYALYTIKARGGGNLVLSDYHKGNWSLDMAKLLVPLIEHQSYIGQVTLKEYEKRGDIDLDLQHAEDDFNPQDFPEWLGPNWPGNCHIAKRYSRHFRINFDFESKWLKAPQTKDFDVIVHAPRRRCTDTGELGKTINLLAANYSVGVIDFDDEWDHCDGTILRPNDFLEAADYINSAKVFVGSVSSCACIAEGLKKWRLVQVAKDCDNSYHAGRTGKTVNGWSGEQIANIAEMIIKHG